MTLLRGIWRGIGQLGGNRWFWTFWAVYSLAIYFRWGGSVAVIMAAIYGALAGWHWRERVATRRIDHLDRVVGRDLIVKAAGFRYVKMRDGLYGWERPAR